MGARGIDTLVKPGGESGGTGGDNYVRTISTEISTDETVAPGGVITQLVVLGIAAGEKLIVSFCGSFYSGGNDARISLSVDGVVIGGSQRAMTPAAPNNYNELSYVGVVEGLVGDHSVEIVNSGVDVLNFLPVSIPEATGASMVIMVVKA